MSGLRRAKDTTGGVTRAAGSAAVSPASTPCAVSLVRRVAPERIRTERRASAARRAPARAGRPRPPPRALPLAGAGEGLVAAVRHHLPVAQQDQPRHPARGLAHAP